MDEIDFETDIDENVIDKYTTDELDDETEKIYHELEKTKDELKKCFKH